MFLRNLGSYKSLRRNFRGEDILHSYRLENLKCYISINGMVFVAETLCVSCEVRTRFLYSIRRHSSWEDICWIQLSQDRFQTRVLKEGPSVYQWIQIFIKLTLFTTKKTVNMKRNAANNWIYVYLNPLLWDTCFAFGSEFVLLLNYYFYTDNSLLKRKIWQFLHSFTKTSPCCGS
jgi:hypothetical protein